MNNIIKAIIVSGVVIIIILLGYFLYKGFQSQEHIKVPVPKTTLEEKRLEDSISETTSYQIEFIADWSTKSHPGNYPENAHFSPFVAYAHNNTEQSLVFRVGQSASPGVEQMAESGETKILNAEIDNLISKGLVFEKTQAESFDSPGRIGSNLEVHKDFSFIIFVSMVAPSPDWFVAQSTNLIEDGKWAEKIELDLITYDAGSDSGADFTSDDLDTQPKEPTKIYPEKLQHLGRIILTQIE